MKTYTASYRPLGTVEWTGHNNVIADGVTEGMPHRFLILEDFTRLEIPVAGLEFRFEKDRHWAMMAKQEP